MNNENIIHVLNEVLSEMNVWKWEKHPFGPDGANLFNVRKDKVTALLKTLKGNE